MLGIVHFCDAGVIGVGIGKDEKQRLSAKAAKVAQDDVPSDVFVRTRNDMELTVLGFQAQPGDHGRADRAKTFAITEGKADVEHPAAYFGAIGLEHNLREVSQTLIVRKLGHIGAIDFRGGRNQRNEMFTQSISPKASETRDSRSLLRLAWLIPQMRRCG